jgi:hydroxyacylglutathione hydrolase
MHLEQFFVDGLGHASYLLACPRTGDAAIVDPRRDIEAYFHAAARAGFSIKYVLETHVHNDFLSGARILAAESGAQHIASAAAGLRFRYRGVTEGCALPLGSLELAVLETPGHTPEHISYVVVDTAHADASLAVFTGGDLLVGGSAGASPGEDPGPATL